uniref:Uncharacterized protein n=1 Tax=Myotis myotis TaxID=51298 RepID=A0A7J7TTP4_MYOMY|nr:hypothetical protein mMyoMyo1_008943 [Myotis myotis]
MVIDITETHGQTGILWDVLSLMNHMSGTGTLDLRAFKVAAAKRACGDTHAHAVPQVAVQWDISPHLCFGRGGKKLCLLHSLGRAMETTLLETGIKTEPAKGFLLTFTIIIIERRSVLLLNCLY